MCKLEQKNIAGIFFLCAPQLEKKFGMNVYFTSRLGGHSKRPFDSMNMAFHVGDHKKDVMKNRQKIKESFNLDNHIYYLKQVHSSNIKVVNRGSKEILKNVIAQADGMVTSMDNTPLMVMGADCTLVVVADKVKRLIAVAHSGWKGTLNKILAKTLNLMREDFFSSPDDIMLYIGPAIRKCCYSISQERAEGFKEIFGEGNYYQNNCGKIYIDLPSLVKKQAKREGIADSNIHDSNICTFCDKRFFSYRRDNVTGRQGAIGVLRD